MSHTSAILEAVSFAVHQLLAGCGREPCMTAVLERLGTAADVSRVYVFRNHINAVGDLLTSQEHEWVAEGITPQIDNPALQNFSYAANGFDHWRELLSNNVPVAGNVMEMPDQAREMLAAQGIRSLLVIPVRVADAWWGFIGFDDCRSERTWSQEELCALQTAASALGAAIECRAVHSEHHRLFTAIQQLAETVVITDTDGVIEYVNPACERLLGYTAAEVRGRTPAVWRGTAHDKTFYAELWAAIRAGTVWRGSLHNRARDGAEIEEEAIISPVFDDGGRIINFVKIARDVREQRRMQSIAATVETMNNIGYVFAGVQHEIGNAVTALKIAVKLLGNNLRDASRARMDEIVALSKAELQRIEDLLNSMRAFNMYERVNLQMVKMAEFLPECMRLMQNNCRQRGIALEIECKDPALRVRADARLLHHVMLNLIINAIDAVNGHPAPAIRVVAGVRHEYAELRVEDNGCGMDARLQQEIFKPFVTTKPHGTGLGLVLARNMLAKMNGTIVVQSVTNAGTTVLVTLMREIT